MKFNFLNKILFASFLLYTIASFSQKNLSSIKGKELHNKVRINYIPVQMPSDEFPSLKSTMGTLGLHYHIPINNWLYGGAGMYAALLGDQGGYFGLGIEAGVNKQLYKNLYIDANVHFGGGGGYRRYVNDGALVNPNIGLQYKKNDFSFGVQYSHFNFYTGEIKSNSVSFFIEIPSVLRITDYANSGKNFDIFEEGNFWSRPVVKNAQQVRFDFFHPIGKSKKDNGDDLEETLYVLGFEYQKYLQENMFLFVHTDAIYKGLRAGFMDLFFGAGYHPYQSKYINVFTKLAIGAAGGRIAPEGGLTVYPSAGIDLKLSNNLALSGHGGYYRAIDGDFEAYTLGFGLKYYGLSGGTKTSEEIKTVKAQGITASIENQTYFDVIKTDDPNNILETDLQLLALQVNYDLTKNVYVLGEASFAYGGRSGGYAHGLVGIGAKTNQLINKRLNFFVEAGVGAAGGAGVDTGEGIILKPTAGFNYTITNAVEFTASGGQLIAPFGEVNSTHLNLGLNFNFATLLAKHK